MVGDTRQPAPGPAVLPHRPHPPTPAPTVGSDARAVLADWGLTEAETAAYEEVEAFGG